MTRRYTETLGVSQRAKFTRDFSKAYRGRYLLSIVFLFIVTLPRHGLQPSGLGEREVQQPQVLAAEAGPADGLRQTGRAVFETWHFEINTNCDDWVSFLFPLKVFYFPVMF